MIEKSSLRVLNVKYLNLINFSKYCSNNHIYECSPLFTISGYKRKRLKSNKFIHLTEADVKRMWAISLYISFLSFYLSLHTNKLTQERVELQYDNYFFSAIQKVRRIWTSHVTRM